MYHHTSNLVMSLTDLVLSGLYFLHADRCTKTYFKTPVVHLIKATLPIQYLLNNNAIFS